MKRSLPLLLALSLGLVIGAGFAHSSRAQESPKMADAIISYYREAINDPEQLRGAENRILGMPDEQAQTHLLLLQAEQNAQIIALLKQQQKTAQTNTEATPKISPRI